VLKSTNRGRSWKSISGNLPERHLVWRLVQDHVNPRLLFLGTEFGVFFSVSGGNNWTKLAGGAPNIPFRDLAIQKRENDLVGATFGRSFYILDDYTPLRNLTEASLQNETMLFPVRDAWWYLPRMPMGESKTGSKSSQGDAYFVAPNPPFGAVISYYLPNTLETAKEKRRKHEKEIEKTGGNTPMPAWDALRAEEIEEAAAVVLTVRDSEGEIIRKLEGPATAGFHRVAWDLRYPRSDAWAENAAADYINDRFQGPLAVPGNYTVSLATRVDGQFKDSGLQSAINVKLMRQNSLATVSAAEVVAFSRRLDDLNRKGDGADAAIKALLKEMAAIKQTLLRSLTDESLRETARALELELLELQVLLTGHEARDLMGAQAPVSIAGRLGVAMLGTALASYGPTPTHIRSLEIAEAAFTGLEQRLDKLTGHDLPALRTALDQAGVPWTPGRVVPSGE